MVRPTQLLILVLVVVVPAVHGFFRACNSRKINLPTKRSELKSMIDNLFPARVYMRSITNTEERRYSCIEIDITGSKRQEAMNRSLDVAFDPISVQRDDEDLEDEELSFTATLKFVESEEEDEIVVKHKRVFQEDDTGITFEGLPVTMFQADQSQKRASLTLSYLTPTFAVFDACVYGFLGTSSRRTSYMFVNKDFDHKPLDYRCVAKGLQERTGISDYEPAGICS